MCEAAGMLTVTPQWPQSPAFLGNFAFRGAGPWDLASPPQTSSAVVLTTSLPALQGTGCFGEHLGSWGASLRCQGLPHSSLWPSTLPCGSYIFWGSRNPSDVGADGKERGLSPPPAHANAFLAQVPGSVSRWSGYSTAGKSPGAGCLGPWEPRAWARAVCLWCGCQQEHNVETPLRRQLS